MIPAAAQSVDPAAEINRKIEETLLASGSYGSDLSWITDGNRTQVIQNLLERYNHPEINSPGYIKVALVRAGHWDTILGLIEDLKTPAKNKDALMYADERIIPYLMPLVYNGSTADPNPHNPGDDVFFMPVRHSAISHVLGRIVNCEAFPAKTRKWAKDLRANQNGHNYKDEAWVGLITSWWEHNQDAIREKRYKDATWLPSYRGVPINRTPEEMRQIVEYLEQENATRLAKRTGPADAPGEYVRSSTPRPGEMSGENPEGKPSKLFWIGIGGLVTIAGYTFWRRFAAKNA